MDEYEFDLQMDYQDEIDAWEGEEKVSTAALPPELWSDHDTNQQPPEPAAEIDRLANQVELQWVLSMTVLVKPGNYNKLATQQNVVMRSNERKHTTILCSKRASEVNEFDMLFM